MISGVIFKYVSGGLLIACMILGLALKIERAHSHKLSNRVTEITQLREADRRNYAAAAKEAELKNREDVARKEAEYRRNNDEAVSNLNARIERLRRELSAQSGADQGSAGGSSPPQADDSQRAPGAAGVCLAPEVILRAAENEERHDQLITLIRKQLGLD